MEKINISLNQPSEIKLPSNLEAEQALIGSVMVNNDIIDEVSNIVNSNKFFDPAHRKIYEVIENLNNKGMIANPITLKNFFEKGENYSEEKKLLTSRYFSNFLLHLAKLLRTQKLYMKCMLKEN